jgi:integrase
MRIYRQSIRRDGQTLQTGKWYADVYVEGKRHRLPLHKSKSLSEKTARRIEELIGLRLAGESPGADMQKWIAQQPPEFIKRLAKIGLISGSRAAAGTALNQHIKSFRAHLLASGVTSKQAEQQSNRAERVLSEAGCRSLQDITSGKILLAIDRLKKQVSRKNPKTGKVESVDTAEVVSPMTKRHHIRAIKQFTKWLQSEGAMPVDPLVNLTIKNVQITNQRRALSQDEAAYLIEWTFSKGGFAYNMSGPERGLVYQLALETGLRRDEIRSLKRTSFDFDGLSVQVDSAYTKNRKAATVPVKAATMTLIKQHLKSKMPTAQAFGLADNHTARMLQDDMTAAREDWIQAVKDNPSEHRRRVESDFLKVDTHDGKVDFHCLRHTFATWLVQAGVDIKTTQTLLRHSTPAMTLGIYAHAQSDNLTAAINSLPDFETKESITESI